MTGFLRPEALAFLTRWREVAVAFLPVLLGAWVFTFGGWFFQGLGIAFALAGLAGALIAFRRMRFRRAVEQPGIVEIDEGQVRYFGPHGGGFVAIPELSELGLMPDRSGQRWWQLTEAGGQVLAIPVTAAGADQLFDVFAGLPGLGTATLLDALDTPVHRPITVWRNEHLRALT